LADQRIKYDILFIFSAVAQQRDRAPASLNLPPFPNKEMQLQEEEQGRKAASTDDFFTKVKRAHTHRERVALGAEGELP